MTSFYHNSIICFIIILFSFNVKIIYLQQEALDQQRKIALTDLFHAIDVGGDGNIEEKELVDFLTKIFPTSDNKDMQDKQIKLMIEGLDQDGKIN